MKQKFILLVALFAGMQIITAQQNLPILKATKYLIDIKDGDSFTKGKWNIAPEVNPDIYLTTSLNKKVTFYTDKDSISVKIKKDTKFDFVVLLNDSIKAYTQIKYQPNYLDILKGVKKYNDSEQSEVPKFTYQSQDNPNLMALRKHFKLDSIAGQGNDVSKILNLLHWVHNLIPHRGDKGNPEIKNAMDMITVCKKENRGLNCRGLAIVLNECYLSLGIKSRFITCLPKDLTDPDCHVINIVYAESLKKWIWIDPTMNAYVMNEKGDLLGIEEVRQRLINGRTLILNPDANWNNQSTQTKEYYLENYMAKNLYRLECPVSSEYNLETNKEDGKISYVQLLSSNDNISAEIGSKTKNKNFVVYKTTNTKLFWQVP